jgi:hypothetical protein
VGDSRVAQRIDPRGEGQRLLGLVAARESTTPVLNGAAIPVGARAVPALAAAGSSSGPGSVTIPAGLAAGTYYLVAKSDDGDDAVAELSETNNTRYHPLDVLP